MTHSTLAPVFAGLRLALHALLLGLAVFACVRSSLLHRSETWAVLVVGVGFVGIYVVGAAMSGRRSGTKSGEPSAGHDRAVALWVGVLSALWAVFVWLSPDAAYLVFPLFFLYLHLLHGRLGYAAIVVSAVFAILALGWHQGFSAGGVVGPLIGAGVAVLIGLGYRALLREADERERLLQDLLVTREQLAASEREQGASAERARLARDIHDTVAQGLTSIQMLVRAAERTSEEPAAGYLSLARETAANSLAETRQLIRELTPTRLEHGLAPALRRLGAETAGQEGVSVRVEADETELPMSAQTALLRIAQGALSNVVRHAAASNVTVELTTVPQGDGLGATPAVRLAVKDDGKGFDVEQALTESSERDSFGLVAMRERAAQFDGSLFIDAELGTGTTIAAVLPLATSEDETA